ncbi:MAG: flagellar motor switch protein FliN [Chloroflexota bacterium]|jgi:flagellar motor switch protein FliN/FliY|uniref:Flagellar motor switch protein FliN n=1 Tax=Bellilinea caldifistulae TaxID=360411 RepID=A0A7C4Q2B9_9CHLR|nr:flagellar motor switch protein FliN [Bellilinea sp.]
MMNEQNLNEFENSSPPVRTASSSAVKTSTRESASIDLFMDVMLKVTVELGRTRMTLQQVLDLQNGSVVELDRLAGDPVDVFVNDLLIARGEVVVVDDKFGVRITEVISPENRKGGL